MERGKKGQEQWEKEKEEEKGSVAESRENTLASNF